MSINWLNYGSVIRHPPTFPIKAFPLFNTVPHLKGASPIKYMFLLCTTAMFSVKLLYIIIGDTFTMLNSGGSFAVPSWDGDPKRKEDG